MMQQQPASRQDSTRRLALFAGALLAPALGDALEVDAAAPALACEVSPSRYRASARWICGRSCIDRLPVTYSTLRQA